MNAGLSVLLAFVVFVAGIGWINPPLIQRALAFEPVDVYVLASLPAVIAGVGLILVFSQRKRISRGRWTSFTAAIVATAFMLATSRVYFLSKSTSIDPLGVHAIYGGLFAAFFATSGWIITNYLTFLNARKAHTMTVLMQFRNSAILSDHMARIYAKYDVEIPITICLLYTSPSPRDRTRSRMPSSA